MTHHQALLLRPFFVAALAAAPLAMGLPAAAQDTTNATGAAIQVAQPSQITVISGFTFKVDAERLRISGIRSPRIVRAQCFYEKRRGRAAQRALKRLLARGPIEIVRTGGSSASGVPLVRVVANGLDVRQRLLAMDYVRPGSSQRANPWCVPP